MSRIEISNHSGIDEPDVRTSIQTVLIVFGFGVLGVFMGLTALLF